MTRAPPPAPAAELHRLVEEPDLIRPQLYLMVTQSFPSGIPERDGQDAFLP